jgi:hypothetical protein
MNCIVHAAHRSPDLPPDLLAGLARTAPQACAGATRVPPAPDQAVRVTPDRLIM